MCAILCHRGLHINVNNNNNNSICIISCNQLFFKDFILHGRNDPFLEHSSEKFFNITDVRVFVHCPFQIQAKLTLFNLAITIHIDSLHGMLSIITSKVWSHKSIVEGVIL